MAQAYSWPALSIGEPEDMASLRERARKEGFDEGYQSGHKSALQEAAELRLALTESLAAVGMLERTLEEADQQALFKLLQQLTAALIGVEVTTNANVISTFVSEAIELLNDERSEVVLNINAADESWLTDLPGIRTLVGEQQAVGTFSLSTSRASVEFEPLARLAELLEGAGATSEYQPVA